MTTADETWFIWQNVSAVPSKYGGSHKSYWQSSIRHEANRQIFVTLLLFSFCGSAVCIMLLALGALGGLPLCVPQNHGCKEVKAVVDKQETQDFAAVDRDPKRKRADIAKELNLSLSTASTVVGKRKLAYINILILLIEQSKQTWIPRCFCGSNNTTAALDIIQCNSLIMIPHVTIYHLLPIVFLKTSIFAVVLCKNKPYIATRLASIL